MATNNKVYNATVERTGDKIILPEGGDIPSIVAVLERLHESENQTVKVSGSVNCPPWDGALALYKAIAQELGFTMQNPSMGFFGPEHPYNFEVEIGVGKTITVAWGEFTLPGMESASVKCNMTKNEKGPLFQATILCKAKYKERARKILDAMRKLVIQSPIHKGCAFEMSFRDADGEPVAHPTPRFFPLSATKPIFRATLESGIERNILTPIRNKESWLAMGESLKRGVLFAGEYGVGKTLLASYIATVANENGWTFIYGKDCEELPELLQEAQRLQPTVVFVEDVERVTGPARDDGANSVLNALDGIDGKSAQVMTVLTTNHPDQVHPAMRRPGRIDVILQVHKPDAEAVGRMVVAFAKDSLAQGADISAFAQRMAGLSPSHIREAVARARLESLRRTGEANQPITGGDLAVVAEEVASEAGLFRTDKGNDHARTVAAIGLGFQQAGNVLGQLVNGGAQAH